MGTTARTRALRVWEVVLAHRLYSLNELFYFILLAAAAVQTDATTETIRVVYARTNGRSTRIHIIFAR